MRGEPVPVFRQQRHFPRDHAELGATAALGRLGRRSHGVARRDGFFAATQVQVGRLAAGIAEDQRMPLRLRLLRPQDGHGDLVQGTDGEAAPLQESGVDGGNGLVHAANSIRVKLSSQLKSG